MQRDENHLLEDINNKLHQCRVLVNQASKRQEAIEKEIEKTKMDLSNIQIRQQLTNQDSFILNV